MIDFIKDFLSRDLKISGEKIPLNLIELLIHFIVPVIVLLILYKLVIRILYKSLKNTSVAEETRIKIIGYIRICFRVLLLIASMILVDKLLGEEVAKYLKLILGVINEPFFMAGSTSISVLTVIMMIPLFYFSSWAGKIVYKMLDTSFMDSAGIDEAKRFTIAKLIRYTTTLLTLLVGLSIIGIDLSSISVILGMLGIGLGFGLQNLIANLFAGIVIIITHPIKEGDLITVAQNRGVITKINTISTVVTTLMNETIIVPNSLLISDVIYNDSYSDRSVIIKNSVSVAYDTDIELVKSLLSGIAERNPYARAGTSPDSRVYNFGSSGIEMVIYSTINDVADRGAAIAWNNFEIWREFKANSIVIPYSQMDVHIKEE